MNQQTGKYLILSGIFILAIGILVFFFHDKLKWFGRLPGDIRIEKENFRFYFPLTSMILLSLFLSLLLQLVKKFF